MTIMTTVHATLVIVTNVTTVYIQAVTHGSVVVNVCNLAHRLKITKTRPVTTVTNVLT